MVTLYNVISTDGYIARKNGDEDFIPDKLWNDFVTLCKKNDAIIIGGRIYKAIQQYPQELIEQFEKLKIKRIVVTNNLNFTLKPEYIITHSFKEAFSFGKNTLLSSGPGLNTPALKQQLIDEVILNILPVKIGDGIKQFDTKPKLLPISEKNMKDGRKWCEYKVAK